ncbi:hypothetical protein PHMEG_0006833 [Phytophthora megakarya]|uniref:Integrase catalytic domain-containing protein n=1 Tax=Phytophthora megakarya TaxID=4795 RepID=A0A225WMX9_9STRA|nr:hypothetical protein PHMEG_0006833 [Phytophthora megakarya]
MVSHLQRLFSIDNLRRTVATFVNVCLLCLHSRGGKDIPQVIRSMTLEYRICHKDWVYLVPIMQSSLNRTVVPSLGSHSPLELFVGLKNSTSLSEIYLSNTPACKSLLNKKRERGENVVNFTVGDYVLRSRVRQQIVHLVTSDEQDVHASILKFYSADSLDVTDELLDHVSSQGIVLAVDKLKDRKWNSDINGFEILIGWKGLQPIEDSFKPMIDLAKDIRQYHRLVMPMDLKEMLGRHGLTSRDGNGDSGLLADAWAGATVRVPRSKCRNSPGIPILNGHRDQGEMVMNARMTKLADNAHGTLELEQRRGKATAKLEPTCRQVMSPTGSDGDALQPSHQDVQGTDVQEANVVSDQFEQFDATLEGLLEGMAKQQARFMQNQEKMQSQLLQQRAESVHPPTFENTFSGSSAFTDFITARDRRMRVNSLDASMPTATAAAPIPVTTTRPVERAVAPEPPQVQQQKQEAQPTEQFVPPVNFGVKIPKPRDLDWLGFVKFSGKEVYPGLGADFKAWGLRFLQRLAAAQQMSGGDWPEEFRILALNGKLDGTALVYFERILPLWTADKDDNAKESKILLAVGTGTSEDKHTWILDSGSSVNLVKDANLLKNAKACNEQYLAANGESIRVSKKGSVELKTVVDGHGVVVNLAEVYHAQNLQDNIISYGRLEEKGVFLERHKGKSYAVHQESGVRVFEVNRRHKVLVVDVVDVATEVNTTTRVNAVSNAVQEANEGLDDAVTETKLLEMHRRLGHLAYDTVERMADTPGSAIRLTDRARPNCLTGAQGKQSKNSQSKKDSGKNAPIDKIGGVIGSDIKGPMTPRDRRGNIYLINFVDYSTNYVRVFLAKNKVEATKKFEHFLVYFEKMYNYTIHVLRTDGGKEYVNVDPFCAATGVRRQISERENQASNGKAERMHRTILNVARCMLFASGLPLYFGGDAVEYAAFVLIRSSCRSNTKRRSPIEMLTGKVPSLSDIVIFGSPCTVYRDPGKKAWKTRAEVGMIVGKQEYGVDYSLTFSAVLEMASGKLILVISRIWGVPARHGDVPSAYVKARTEANLIILLIIPQGMEFTEQELSVLGVKNKHELALTLDKGLYGLKQ